MSSIVEGYNYDIFISYRQKDNKGERWVSEFVEALKTELESTFKDEISVYFDINPSDYLLESYDVDASLKDKLKCLIFIPIISRTYCDPKSFSWEHEFKTFVNQASQDQFGLKIKLPNGNVANRVLPIQIHEIASDDKVHIEEALGGVLRPIEFIYKEPGVNRPLRSNEDHPDTNLNKTFYRNQINKVANAIDEIINGLKSFQTAPLKENNRIPEPPEQVRNEMKKEERGMLAKFAGKKLLISLIVIGTLLVTAALFVYPKLFKQKSNLDAMTLPVTVINEKGEKEVRRVFKDGYISNLAIYPFINGTNDSSKSWLQIGFPEAIAGDLLQFNYVSLRLNMKVKHLQEQIKDAEANNYPYFLTGAYRITDGKYEVASKLYQTANGTIIAERIFRGYDFFGIIDSISLQTRIDLGISENVLNSSPDLPIKEHSTNNFNAFRFYIKGLYIDSLYLNLQRSIELDSTFALASYRRASQNYTFQDSYESDQMDIRRAMRHRKRLTEYNDISTRVLYYLILGENDKAISLSEMQYELQPNNVLLLGRLLDTYNRNFKIYKYEKAARELTKLVPNMPDYQINLASGYLLTGELNKGLEVLEKLLKDNPENVNALLLMGQIYLNKNNLEAAIKTYQKAILIQPENEKYWSRMFDHIAYLRNKPVKDNILQPFAGNYQFEDAELYATLFMHNNHLVVKGQNQGSIFVFPISDTLAIFENGLQSFTFLRNNEAEGIKIIYKNRFGSHILWKEDSLILNAKNLLNRNKKAEALTAFREAYSNNPEHYYLANFIGHLEFIQSQEYERIRPVLETYTGRYGNMIIFKKNNNFYYEIFRGLIYKILPLSEDQFMIPSYYDRCIRIIKKNNTIDGLKIIYQDGTEEFFSRTNSKSLTVQKHN